MPAPKGMSVFIGREIRVNRDEVESTRPSIERSLGSPEDFPLVTSDIVRSDFVAYGEADLYSESLGGERAPSVSSRDSQSKEQEPWASTVTATRRRRQHTGRKDTREAFPRRSTRIRATTTITKPAPTTAAAARPKKRVAKEPMSAPSCNTSGEWEIDKIIDSRIEEDTLKHFYLVKWKGFASKHNTWEPKKNLAHCWGAIEAYEKGAK